MMFHEDLFTASGNLLTDDLVALKRDLAERQVLAELARTRNQPGRGPDGWPAGAVPRAKRHARVRAKS